MPKVAAMTLVPVNCAGTIRIRPRARSMEFGPVASKVPIEAGALTSEVLVGCHLPL